MIAKQTWVSGAVIPFVSYQLAMYLLYSAPSAVITPDMKHQMTLFAGISIVILAMVTTAVGLALHKDQQVKSLVSLCIALVIYLATHPDFQLFPVMPYAAVFVGAYIIPSLICRSVRQSTATAGKYVMALAGLVCVLYAAIAQDAYSMMDLSFCIVWICIVGADDFLQRRRGAICDRI